MIPLEDQCGELHGPTDHTCTRPKGHREPYHLDERHPPYTWPREFNVAQQYRSKGAAIVQDRSAQYGSPVPNMIRFAQIIEAILGTECTALQATMIMVGIKILRESHGGHLEDNLDDIEGYVEIARQVTAHDPNQDVLFSSGEEMPGAYSADSTGA